MFSDELQIWFGECSNLIDLPLCHVKQDDYYCSIYYDMYINYIIIKLEINCTENILFF